jgi:uncharacterized protein with GYD domain
MPTYLVLTHFTEKGIQNVKDTVKRADAFADAAKKIGGAAKDLYWAMGRYDSVAIVEAPSDEAMVGLSLEVGKQGNVRTETLRLFTKAEMSGLVSKLA